MVWKPKQSQKAKTEILAVENIVPRQTLTEAIITFQSNLMLSEV